LPGAKAPGAVAAGGGLRGLAVAMVMQAVKDLRGELRPEAWDWLRGPGGELLAKLGVEVTNHDPDEILRRLTVETTGRKAGKQQAARRERMLAALVTSSGFSDLPIDEVVAWLNLRGAGLDPDFRSCAYTLVLRQLRPQLQAAGWELSERQGYKDNMGHRVLFFSLRRVGDGLSHAAQVNSEGLR